jgi:hypothetical protein
MYLKTRTDKRSNEIELSQKEALKLVTELQRDIEEARNHNISFIKILRSQEDNKILVALIIRPD